MIFRGHNNKLSRNLSSPTSNILLSNNDSNILNSHFGRAGHYKCPLALIKWSWRLGPGRRGGRSVGVKYRLDGSARSLAACNPRTIGVWCPGCLTPPPSLISLWPAHTIVPFLENYALSALSALVTLLLDNVQVYRRHSRTHKRQADTHPYSTQYSSWIFS